MNQEAMLALARISELKMPPVERSGEQRSTTSAEQYLQRGVGDVTKTWVTWLSPLGWAEKAARSGDAVVDPGHPLADAPS